MCALYIKTREDIDLLHEINGLSIERIEARARPLEDRTQYVPFNLMILFFFIFLFYLICSI
jgi:hypothetical protein